MVDDRSIARILREHERSRDAAQALLDGALERGGGDNVTVIVARYEIPGGLAQSGHSWRPRPSVAILPGS
jgi:serine/threonine protein phosphatase PrpC